MAVNVMSNMNTEIEDNKGTMDTENKKLDGFYDEIDCPFEKKNDVKEFFKEYKIIEHMNTERDYEYLEGNDVVLEIVNPYQGENLFIEFAGEFILYFSGWHSHYFAYEYDYNEMKKDALAITKGEYGVLCFFVDDNWLGDTLLKEEISHFTNPKELIDRMRFPEEHLQKVRDKGAVILVNYWKPYECYEFDVSKEAGRIDYIFPRRHGVRFVIKDGKCYGSGNLMKYDDETAYINYVCCDLDELQATVIKMLESDAKKSGFSKIFRNIENSEFELYSLLGYTEIEKIDNDRIEQLNGAIVIFDKTMSKEL